MPSRRQLNNLACGIAGKFVSRNNDIDGYWALGLLYTVADTAGTKKVHLDLISKKSIPSFKYPDRLVSHYSEYMQHQLAKFKLEGYVVAATIDIEFNVEPQPHDLLRKSTWGDPFNCCVTLTDDLDCQHKCAVRRWCAQHNPERERRSTRIHPS